MKVERAAWIDMQILPHNKVAILGMGREGRVAWRYLRKKYPEMDLALVDESRPDPGFVQDLKEKDRLIIGPLSELGLETFDVLLRSPGISPYRHSVQKALRAGARIITPSTLWFAEYPAAKTICVTGTKGKSTTSALIAHMLAACGLKVGLAGNIGVPLLACGGSDVDWWVIELSSYQLADLQAKPDISVILNLSPEHLDWHGSKERYYEDKLRLAALTEDGPVIANGTDKVLCKTLSERSNTVWFNAISGFRVARAKLFDAGTRLPVKPPAGLPGAHNLANIAAALTVLRQLGADPAVGLESLQTFRCLPHRLQSLGERHGIQFINDSISSTPVATAAALEAFPDRQVTLIVGGLDRGLDWAPYLDVVMRRLPVAVIGIPDNGARIISDMEKLDIAPRKGLHRCQQLSGAVELAKKLTPTGGVILLSPGAPSFPQFRDYRDRGQQFATLSGLSFEEQDIFPADTSKAAGQG